ncbi:MAG: acyl-ACP thioesterase [Herbinix sp.]|jgi:acyl-ACP thioesterase|nr:acyl-ACP thioesterase [Herbinix sp.]
MYSFNSRVRYSELNHKTEALSCSSIINYFQDCSTFQSEDLNRGLTYLQSSHRVWLLNAWHLKILHPAVLGQTITLGTWPHAFEGAYGYRNFIMQTPEKEVLAVADSIWIYVDTQTGRPTRIPKDYAITSGYGMSTRYPMESMIRKIDMPANYKEYPAIVVKRSNIDSYNHVNNGQYIKIAEEYLPVNYIVSSLRVEYRAQAVEGDILIPLVTDEKNCITITLTNSANQPYALVEFSGNYTDLVQ